MDTPETSWNYDQTALHPLAAVAVLGLAAAMLLLPRRYAPVPMLILGCFISNAQRLALAGLDFDLMRVLILVGLTRVIAYGELSEVKVKWIDGAMLLWALAATLTYVVLWGTLASLIFRLGFLLSTIGLYVVFRALVRDGEDLIAVTRSLVYLAVPVALAFFFEKFTGRNVFAIFGGVPALTEERMGELRCQGAFSHPIMAGSFWVGTICWMMALWPRGSRLRNEAIVGVVAALTIVFNCSSATPIIGIGALVGGLALYKLRFWMFRFFWVGVAFLVLLHYSMTMPVWHLLSRLTIVGGSTGTHRFRLIDAWIAHWSEWIAVGTVSTEHWGHQLFDLTNQYILESVYGGLITMILFILVMAAGFVGVMQRLRLVQNDFRKSWLSWCVWVALMTHGIMFISVSYFGQILFVWYLQLAAMAALTPASSAAGALTEPDSSEAEESSVGRTASAGWSDDPWSPPSVPEAAWQRQDPTIGGFGRV